MAQSPPTPTAGPLARQLDAFSQGLLDRTDPQIASGLRRIQDGACFSGEQPAGLAVGDVAPDFTLRGQDDAPVSLAGALGRGPVMLTFFRGGWCPFCSIALRAFEQLSLKLRREGASLLAVSPQDVTRNAATAASNNLRFPLLADHGHRVAARYGLVWRLDDEAQDLYRRLGHDIPALNGADAWELPVPASFVVAPDGRIVFAHVDPRAAKRIEPDDALAAVRAIRR